MAIMRWNPVRDLLAVQREMDRLMSDFVSPWEGFGEYRDGGLWAPAVDVSEDKDNVHLAAELPGLRKEDVKVTIEDHTLTLRGEKRQADLLPPGDGRDREGEGRVREWGPEDHAPQERGAQGQGDPY